MKYIYTNEKEAIKKIEKRSFLWKLFHGVKRDKNGYYSIYFI